MVEESCILIYFLTVHPLPVVVDSTPTSTLPDSQTSRDTISLPTRETDSPQGSDSPTLNTSTAPHDLDAERSHYRPNVPKLRRRSSSGEVDDMRRFSFEQRQQRFQAEEEEGCTKYVLLRCSLILK